MDSELDELWFLTLLVIVIVLARRRGVTREKLSTSSLTGKEFVQELIDGSSTVMYRLCRMEKPAFHALCDHFKERGYLSDSKHLDVEEKMVIFLMTLSHTKSNRYLQSRFQHSGQTISKYFHEVLQGMLKFAREMIVPPSWDAPPGEIRDHRQLREGPFKGAVGALDGTLIRAVVPHDKQIPFRGRGGKECFQNVMAICDFDMKFTYVVAGWEGVAHDSRVLCEAKRKPSFKFPMPPPDKYYLCDAAYALTKGFLTPYRGKRYWLGDFRRGGRPRDREEKFNHGHSQLRNVIERAFGVLKARFPILKDMPPYDFPTQRRIVMACMALHNFLRRVTLDDDLFSTYEENDMEVNNGIAMDSDTAVNENNIQDQSYMTAYRNHIANELDQMFPN